VATEIISIRKILLPSEVVKRKIASSKRPFSLAKFDNFHSKYCILKENAKNNISGRSGYKTHSSSCKKWGLFYPGHKPPECKDIGKPLVQRDNGRLGKKAKRFEDQSGLIEPSGPISPPAPAF